MTAAEVIEWCRRLAAFSEEPGYTTRTFLSPPTRDVHACLRAWMERLGMRVSVDAAGNLRGVYGSGPRLLIASHLDTVPRAGAFDGVLGVVLGIALIENLQGRALPYAIEVIGFSEEEGVRFGFPFIGSRGYVGTLDESMLAQAESAIREFGLTPPAPCTPLIEGQPAAYLEFHIEQGPVLDKLQLPLGIVDATVGQSRLSVQFEGKANHAGTTPMALRHDALAGAAEWIGSVERLARTSDGLVATVGKLDVEPGAGNIVPGTVTATLDVRHVKDAVRHAAVARLLQAGEEIAWRRGLQFRSEEKMAQSATALDCGLRMQLERAVQEAGYPVQHLHSGAGHDAMIVAPHVPSAMLFLRSPEGLSHHPDESVREEDVAAALVVGQKFLEMFHA